MIPGEFVQFFIIVGNILGWLGIYYLVDRKIDKKILKYWRKVRNSEEGQDLFGLVKEAKKMLKSDEGQRLFKEVDELVSDFRAILKKIKERSEAPEEESEEDSVVLPRLVSKKKKKAK